MPDFAIGASFHKAHRTLVRAVLLPSPKRLYATRSSDGWITLPTLPAGLSYVEMQGVTQANFTMADNDREFRLFGDSGWSDSITLGSNVRCSMRSFFMKNIEQQAGSDVPVFRGDYSEDFALVERCRWDKTAEVYIELLKEMGQLEGSSGNYIYDYAGFNCAFRNYNDGGQAEGLTEIGWDAMSRDQAVFGRYNAGASPLSIGQVQSALLFLVPGTRQAATVPANNASAVVVSADLTVTYTTNGSVALTQLALGQPDGSGFRLENAATGVRIPAVVTLASNVVTINPASDLPAATIFRLVVNDGAITQALDLAGNPSPTGFRRPIQGFSTVFRTA